jgi:hypothetical protein
MSKNIKIENELIKRKINQIQNGFKKEILNIDQNQTIKQN